MKRLLTLTTIFTFLLLPLATLGQVVNPPSGGGGAPSGPAGGDLSGTYPNPTVTGSHINAGTINTAIIGGTTPAAITGTTITAGGCVFPAFAISGAANTGIAACGSALYEEVNSNFIDVATSSDFRFSVGIPVGWSSNAQPDNAALDTAFSRDAADTVDCGNGTAQDKSCTLNLATINASASLNATTDGVHAGILSLVGNTTNPTIPANQFGWLGFPSTSATAYFLQPSTTAPNGNFLQCAAPSSGVSTCSWASAASLPSCTATQFSFYNATGTTQICNPNITDGGLTSGFTYYPGSSALTKFIIGNTANTNGANLTINSNNAAGDIVDVKNQFSTLFSINSSAITLNEAVLGFRQGVQTTASTAPALDAFNDAMFVVNLSGNTTATIGSFNSGTRYVFEICQPASGGPFTWTAPTSVHNFMTIGVVASTCSIQSFVSTNGSTMVPESIGITGVTP